MLKLIERCQKMSLFNKLRQLIDFLKPQCKHWTFWWGYSHDANTFTRSNQRSKHIRCAFMNDDDVQKNTPVNMAWNSLMRLFVLNSLRCLCCRLVIRFYDLRHILNSTKFSSTWEICTPEYLAGENHFFLRKLKYAVKFCTWRETLKLILLQWNLKPQI